MSSAEDPVSDSTSTPPRKPYLGRTHSSPSSIGLKTGTDTNGLRTFEAAHFNTRMMRSSGELSPRNPGHGKTLSIGSPSLFKNGMGSPGISNGTGSPGLARSGLGSPGLGKSSLGSPGLVHSTNIQEVHMRHEHRRSIIELPKKISTGSGSGTPTTATAPPPTASCAHIIKPEDQPAWQRSILFANGQVKRVFSERVNTPGDKAVEYINALPPAHRNRAATAYVRLMKILVYFIIAVAALLGYALGSFELFVARAWRRTTALWCLFKWMCFLAFRMCVGVVRIWLGALRLIASFVGLGNRMSAPPPAAEPQTDSYDAIQLSWVRHRRMEGSPIDL